jgi:hypothetical protein
VLLILLAPRSSKIRITSVEGTVAVARIVVAGEERRAAGE